jgi:hypothetical protein
MHNGRGETKADSAVHRSRFDPNFMSSHRHPIVSQILDSANNYSCWCSVFGVRCWECVSFAMCVDNLSSNTGEKEQASNTYLCKDA